MRSKLNYNSAIYYQKSIALLIDETDGRRAFGRICHSSLLRSFSQAEMIYLCINTRPSNPHMSNAVQVHILIGKYLLLNG